MKIQTDTAITPGDIRIQKWLRRFEISLPVLVFALWIVAKLYGLDFPGAD